MQNAFITNKNTLAPAALIWLAILIFKARSKHTGNIQNYKYIGTGQAKAVTGDLWCGTWWAGELLLRQVRSDSTPGIVSMVRSGGQVWYLGV